MNQFQKIQSTVLLLMVLWPWSKSYAQQPGSSSAYAGTVAIVGIQSDVAESLYIGPGNYTIDGTWEIYSKNVWIDPSAIIIGRGKIVFKNPQLAGGVSGPTMIDGNNGTTIDVNIEMDNEQDMILTDIPFTDFGSSNPSGPLAAALNIGKDFNLATDNGDVVLNGHDFAFDEDATISGYRVNRYVQTGNSIAGHMIKSFGSSSSFIFPVGFPAANSYNPAEITAENSSIHVGLQNNAASTSDESAITEGIDRTWHIYANAETAATISLQHDPGTELSGFDRTDNHFVTRWLGTTVWEVNTPGAGTDGNLTTGSESPIANTLRSVSVVVSASPSATLSYYTKTTLAGLPVDLISFDARPQNSATVLLTWKTASEVNHEGFVVERSKDLVHFEQVGKSNESNSHFNGTRSYQLIDNQPYRGTSYYRLTQVDIDGRQTRYPFRSVILGDIRYGVFPNPVSYGQSFSLELDEPETAQVFIWASTGKQVKLTTNRKNSNSVDFSAQQPLAPGIYIVTVAERGQVKVHKLVVQ